MYGGVTFSEPLKSQADRRDARRMSKLSHHHMARAVVAHKRIGGGFRSLFKRAGKIGRRAAHHFVKHADTYVNVGTAIAEQAGVIDPETGEGIRDAVSGGREED